MVRRALRDYNATMPADAVDALEAVERRLTDVGRRALIADDVALLRGLEGEAASFYFGVF